MPRSISQRYYSPVLLMVTPRFLPCFISANTNFKVQLFPAKYLSALDRRRSLSNRCYTQLSSGSRAKFCKDRKRVKVLQYGDIEDLIKKVDWPLWVTVLRFVSAKWTFTSKRAKSVRGRAIYFYTGYGNKRVCGLFISRYHTSVLSGFIESPLE